MARALLLSLLLAPLAAAQPMAPDAAPAAGTLSPGAEPAELELTVRAETEVPVDGCVGFVAPSAPDAVVEWDGGDLRVWTRAPFDATLAVHRPDGTWACDDDTEGVSPVVQIGGATAGRYAVWLGSFSPEPMGASATLFAGTPPPPPVLETGAEPFSGRIEAEGGFEASQGMIEVAVEAGGPDSADALDGDLFCSGYIHAARPTAIVDYNVEGGTGTLALGASSFEDDLVIVVTGPDGEITCVDDYDGTDPLALFEGPASGAYAVWVGTFGAMSERVPATLTVAETAPEFEYYDDFEDYEEPLDGPYSEGSYFPIDLDAAPSVRVEARGGDGGTSGSASTTIQPAGPNPVQGPSCTGYVESAATARIALSGEGPFALRASAEEDLTLTVRTPSGAWFCSDDADGLDPGIQIDEAEAGEYLAWVGAFSEFAEALEVSLEAGPGVVEYADGDLGGPYGVEPQSEGAYDGDAIGAGPSGLSLDARGAGLLSQEVGAGGSVLNPVVGDACHGFVGAAPTASVEADGGLVIGATGSGTDLTLVVRAPDGSWTCSDDADGSDPRATVDGGPGTYDVWVGTYSRRTETVPATLEVEPAE